MREICTSGSVGGEGGNILAYPAHGAALSRVERSEFVTAPLPSAPRRRVLPVEEDSTSIVDRLIE